MRAAIIVAFFTLLCQLVSIAKELIVAAYFGTGDDLDAFLIALLLPLFIINVLTGSFTSSFLPTFIRIMKEEGIDKAQELFSRIMGWGIGLLCLVVLLLALLAPFYLPVLCSGFSAAKLKMTESIILKLLPIILFKGISNIWAGILNALERFAFAAIVPAFVPLCSVIFILTAGVLWGIEALVIGTIIGFGMEAFFLGVALKRRGFSLLPQLKYPGADMRIVFGQYFPMVAGALIMGSTEIVDKSMAAALSSGSVSALNYGNKIISLVLGLAATAIGTVMLPFFSKMVAEEGWESIRETLRFYLGLIFSITIPVVALIFWFSEPLVQIVFQRGLFTPEDTQAVSSIQALFSFQIPFYIASIVVVRLISSLRANHILMWGAVINLTVNIGLNFLFIHYLGLKGIALSTSCVYFISFIFLFYFSYRLVSQQESMSVKTVSI